MIAFSFVLPISVLVYLMVININAGSDFAEQELLGDAYQRPVEDLLEHVQGHQLAALAGSPADKLKAMQAQIDKDFEALASVTARVGTALQFTEAGLGKRNRLHVQGDTVSREWKELAALLDKGTSPATLSEKYDHLAADLRTLITHAGDTSNLILDPDLDSYYLMDVTLLALPQTQDRIAKVTRAGFELITRGAMTPPEGVQMAVHAALLQEADLDRVKASTETALNEDANFYGVSPTLQGALKAGLAQYGDATASFIALTKQVAAGTPVTPADYLKAGMAAQSAAFVFWRAAVDEEDKLLKLRIADYTGKRTRSLMMSAAAVLLAALLAFYLKRTITTPLAALVKNLGPGADLLGVCAERIAAASKNKSANPEEAELICEELTAHCGDMRKAVAELSAQVQGSGPGTSA